MTKDEFKQYCLAQSNWWIAYATTGLAKNRKMWRKESYRGEWQDVDLTDEEKIQEALDTAQQHLDNYFKTCNGIDL